MKNALALIASLGLVVGAAVFLLGNEEPDEPPPGTAEAKIPDGTPAPDKITVASSQDSGERTTDREAQLVPQVLDPAGGGGKSPVAANLLMPPPPVDPPVEEEPSLPPELHTALTEELGKKLEGCIESVTPGAATSGASVNLSAVATVAGGKLSASPVAVAVDGADPAALEAMTACSKAALADLELDASGHEDADSVPLSVSLERD